LATRGGGDVNTFMAPDITAGLRWLAGLSLFSVVFLATPQGDAYRWVDMSWVAFAVIAVAAVFGLIASLGNAMLAMVGAVLCFFAAAVQFVSAASGEPGIVDGNASTWTLLAAIGLGYLVLGLVEYIPKAPGDE
jgi:hypothetical protein